MYNRAIHRGNIFYIENAKNYNRIGSEQGGSRPGIVVSNDQNNEFSPVVEVVYLTTQDKKPLPTHVAIDCKRKSTVLCEAVNSVSKDRIGTFIRACATEELNQIDKALLISLGIKEPVNITPACEVPVAEPVYVSDDNSRAAIERDIYMEMYQKLLDKVV